MGIVILFLSCFVFVFVVIRLIRSVHQLWWIPRRISKFMAAQGIKGPSYRLIHGNTKEISNMQQETRSRGMSLNHDIFPCVQPHFHLWTNLYGRIFLQWHGAQAQLVIQEPELCKEILNSKLDGDYPKREPTYFLKKIFGNGLATVIEHEKWAKSRRIANHAFHGENLKNMITDMISSAETMLERWNLHEGKEIEVHEQFRMFTSEVISKTAFGSSYKEGELIFQTLQKCSFLFSKNINKVKVPGLSKISKGNDELEAERFEKEINDSIKDIVNKREKKAMCNGEYGNDFLGSLLRAHHDADMSHRISVDDLVDDCKTFYFAGHETTNTLLSWTMLLLALHTDWQEEARNEVITLFGKKQNPNPDAISKLKTMSMIINESLRLYPPVTATVRKAGREVKLGNVIVPADLEFVLSILSLHREHQFWGPDAHLFKPKRFSEGVTKATNKNPGAFIPFGFGPRICVGSNFAITEAKIALSMILQRYSFTLSSGYVHSPFQAVTVVPQHGVQVILQSL